MSRFNTLNHSLSFHDDLRTRTNKSDVDSQEQSTSKLDESVDDIVIEKFFDDTEYPCTTPILAPVYNSNQERFQGTFDDSEIVDPSKGIV